MASACGPLLAISPSNLSVQSGWRAAMTGAKAVLQ
jgi:hypothetical protein